MSAKEVEQIDPKKMVATQEMHCPACGRFLGFQAIIWGLVKVKCPRCKEWTTIDISPEHGLE